MGRARLSAHRQISSHKRYGKYHVARTSVLTSMLSVQNRERLSAHLGKKTAIGKPQETNLTQVKKKGQTRLKSIKSSTGFVRNVVKYGIIPDHHQCKTEHSTHR